MKLKKLKSTTNGVRHQINIQKSLLAKNNRIFRSTIKGFKSCSGRSPTTGHITSWHKCGGHKKLFRDIDFMNNEYSAINLASFYDPYRTSFVFLNFLIQNFMLQIFIIIRLHKSLMLSFLTKRFTTFIIV